MISGRQGEDHLILGEGAIVENVVGVANTSDTPAPNSGALHLQAIETITIDGGTVNNTITGPATATTFNLLSGTIGSDQVGGDIIGGAGDDTFVIGSEIAVLGRIDGGGDGSDMDTLSLASDFVDSANFFETTLTLTFGGTILAFTLIDIENVDITGLTTAGAATLRAFQTGTPSRLDRTGSAGNDVFMITGDVTDGTLIIDGVIDGLGGDDELQLNDGAVVGNVRFTSLPPLPGGSVHLRDIETITLNGGTVNGVFNARGATTSVTINLVSGTANDDIFGSSQNDIFTIAGNITGNSPALAINGVIDGRDEIGQVGFEGDVLILNAGAIVNGIVFSDQAPTEGGGMLHLQDIETIRIEGGMVDGNIDASALHPTARQLI